MFKCSSFKQLISVFCCDKMVLYKEASVKCSSICTENNPKAILQNFHEK